MFTGFALSVWICGEAETILKQKDPGSIVLDEIVAIPLCFFWTIGNIHTRSGALPAMEDFWRPDGSIGLLMTLALFVAFRLFDIWKPWPVRQSQRLPGGWGVTVDDLLAAVYVNLGALLFLAMHAAFR